MKQGEVISDDQTMTRYPIALEVEARSLGITYRGTLTSDAQTGDWRKPISVGLSPQPKEYTRWFNAITPGHAAFCRVFAPPGTGLPNLTGQAISYLPEGTFPWISHKDRVPIASLVAYWNDLRDLYKPITGRPINWTPQHERAPAPDRAEYLAYLRDVADAATDCPWIRVVQIQSNYAMRWRADTDWREWLTPGVALGFDCYPTDYGTGYEPPESTFGLLLAAAAEIGAPAFGVPELGAEVRKGDAQRRASWLTECVTYLDSVEADFVGLWCSQEDRDGRHFDYRPTDAPTLTTFANLLTPSVGER